MEERDYDVPELAATVEEVKTKFTNDQGRIFKIVMQAVRKSSHFGSSLMPGEVVVRPS